MERTTTTKKVLYGGLIVISVLVYIFIFFIIDKKYFDISFSWGKLSTLLLPTPLIAIIIACWLPTLNWTKTLKVFISIGISIVFLLVWSYLLFVTGWTGIDLNIPSFIDEYIDAYLLFFIYSQIITAPLWAIADTYLFLGGREIRRNYSNSRQVLGIAGLFVGTIMWMLVAVLTAGIVFYFIEWR